MRPIADLVPQRSDGPKAFGHVADLFVLAPPPPPDEALGAEVDAEDDRVTAAVKLAAFVVASGFAAGLALWAFGSVAFDAVRRLLT